jgi:ribosomal protein L35AE/L33A
MIKKIKNSIYVKHVALSLVFCTLFMSFKSSEGIMLPAGTSVYLETLNQLDSKTTFVGQTVDFRVRQDVKIGDKVAIVAGSIAKGQIMRTQKAKGLGKEGVIEIQIKSVLAADGQEVMLSGNNIMNQGEEKQTQAIVLGLLICILFLTIKGEDAQVPAGYQFTTNVATNININI